VDPRGGRPGRPPRKLTANRRPLCFSQPGAGATKPRVRRSAPFRAVIRRPPMPPPAPAARTAAAVAGPLDLSDAARGLITPALAPRQFLDALTAAGLTDDAVRFLAAALPKRGGCVLGLSGRPRCRRDADRRPARCRASCGRGVGGEPDRDQPPHGRGRGRNSGVRHRRRVRCGRGVLVRRQPRPGGQGTVAPRTTLPGGPWPPRSHWRPPPFRPRVAARTADLFQLGQKVASGALRPPVTG
jgi:hypothetical protein